MGTRSPPSTSDDPEAIFGVILLTLQQISHTHGVSSVPSNGSQQSIVIGLSVDYYLMQEIAPMNSQDITMLSCSTGAISLEAGLIQLAVL